MSEFFDALNDKHVEMIGKQPLFFVATAASDGRINLSPKGYDSFRVLAPNRVGYIDLGGSGNETHAHLSVDGRITFMFCAFDGPPLILRLYARGRSVQPADGEWSALRPHFGPPMLGERQLIMADIDSVQTSCGFGVPLLEFKEHRPQLREWAERKGPEGVVAYRAEKNRVSIDGVATGYKG